MITKLKEDEIFVFGSNEAGRHGAGAAKQALKWGAKYGIGFGLQGNTFAIPTKDKNLKILPIEKIKEYVVLFIDFAEKHQEYTFLVTAIGCGLAGYKPEQIGPLFTRINTKEICNVIIPPEFERFVYDLEI